MEATIPQEKSSIILTHQPQIVVIQWKLSFFFSQKKGTQLLLQGNDSVLPFLQLHFNMHMVL